MSALVTKPLVMIDVIYSLDLVTKKANNTFVNSARKRPWSQVEFSLKLMERAGSPAIDVTVTKDSLLVYVLNFFRNFGWSVE